MSHLSMFRVATVLAATLPALTLPAAVYAQTNSPAGGAASTGAESALPASVSAKVEQHIKALHDQLGITPGEQPQWEAFAQVMRENAAQMSDAFINRSAKVSGMTAVDNMQSYAQLAQVHATNTQKLASAFQALYNTFPDQQKQLADRIFQNSKGKLPSNKH
jgi:protein CpxP